MEIPRPLIPTVVRWDRREGMWASIERFQRATDSLLVRCPRRLCLEGVPLISVYRTSCPRDLTNYPIDGK